DPRGYSLENLAREELRGGVDAGERGYFVEVAIVQVGEHRSEQLAGQPDVDHHAVGIELAAPVLDVDDVGGAVQPLRRAEGLAAEAVGDHEVVTGADAVHASA